MKNLIIMALIASLFSACSDDNAKPQMYEAYEVAKVLVRSKLKDPDGAEFIDGNRKEAEYKDSSFVFSGYVKATNDLGLKSPIEYNVGIKWRGGYWQSDTSWIVKFGNVGNPNL